MTETTYEAADFASNLALMAQDALTFAERGTMRLNEAELAALANAHNLTLSEGLAALQRGTGVGQPLAYFGVSARKVSLVDAATAERRRRSKAALDSGGLAAMAKTALGQFEGAGAVDALRQAAARRRAAGL